MSNTSLLTCVFGQYNFADADVMTRKPTRMRVRLPRSINFANAFTDVQKRWTSRFHRIGSNLRFLPVPNKEQVPGLGTEPEVRKTAYNDDVTDDVRLLIRFSDGQNQKVEK